MYLCRLLCVAVIALVVLTGTSAESPVRTLTARHLIVCDLQAKAERMIELQQETLSWVSAMERVNTETTRRTCLALYGIRFSELPEVVEDFPGSSDLSLYHVIRVEVEGVKLTPSSSWDWFDAPMTFYVPYREAGVFI